MRGEGQGMVISRNDSIAEVTTLALYKHVYHHYYFYTPGSKDPRG